MASFCVRPNGILQYDLCFYGRRFRESSGLRDTPENRRQMRKNLRRVNAEWETGGFDYAAWFPRSRKLAEAQRWLREHGSRLPDQRFATYADEWYRLHAGDWKASYGRQVRSVLDQYLIPRFGDWPLDAITERAVRAFRQELIDQVDERQRRRLSNARINFIFATLFVSRLLGHLSTKMLFERYAPFVANALADDGSRFERMMRSRLLVTRTVSWRWPRTAWATKSNNAWRQGTSRNVGGAHEWPVSVEV